jgi:hypothetical protein
MNVRVPAFCCSVFATIAFSARGDPPSPPRRTYTYTPADYIAAREADGPVMLPMRTTATVLPFLCTLSETPGTQVSRNTAVFRPTMGKSEQKSPIQVLRVYHNQPLTITLTASADGAALPPTSQAMGKQPAASQSKGSGAAASPPANGSGESRVTIRCYAAEQVTVVNGSASGLPFASFGPLEIGDGQTVVAGSVSPTQSQGDIRLEIEVFRISVPGDGPQGAAVFLVVSAQ